jgi:hypothetical protein
VGLDDYSVETSAAVRDRLGLEGTTVELARHFRDKLAMRPRS